VPVTNLYRAKYMVGIIYIRGADSEPATKCLVNICLELRHSTIVKLPAGRTRYTNDRKLFQTVGVQHENRRAAVFVDEDYVDRRSDVDELRSQDTWLSIWTKRYDQSYRHSNFGVCPFLSFILPVPLNKKHVAV